MGFWGEPSWYVQGKGSWILLLMHLKVLYPFLPRVFCHYDLKSYRQCFGSAFFADRDSGGKEE